MQTLDMINNTEIKGIVDTILTATPVLEIYLFGSFANGTAKDDSDYDFYVVVPDSIQPIETTWLIKGALRKNLRTSRGIDMLVGTESKFNKYKNSISFIERDVVDTGVKLYG
jgi:predicted nucleotidyltransferase